MSYEVWGEPEDGPELPEGWLDADQAAELQEKVDDLSMLVKRLTMKIRQLDPECELGKQATEYLKTHNLCETLRKTL